MTSKIILLLLLLIAFCIGLNIVIAIPNLDVMNNPEIDETSVNRTMRHTSCGVAGQPVELFLMGPNGVTQPETIKRKTVGM